jgi:isopropylmalate/homocitrate/citramalate synthase
VRRTTIGFARLDQDARQRAIGDPKDIGRTYEAVIRVNSQSGKAASPIC